MIKFNYLRFNLKAKHKLNLNVKLESRPKLNLKLKPRYHIMYLVNFGFLKTFEKSKINK